MKTKAFFRPLTQSDCASLARNADNINVWNYVRDYFPHPYTEKDAAMFLGHISTNDPLRDFAIDVEGKAVGIIGYIPQGDVSRISAEIGYWLGEPYWNAGITTTVLKDFTEYVFSSTAIEHLFANVFSTNQASMRVLEKAGFSHCGTYHRAAVKNGERIDLVLYEKLKG